MALPKLFPRALGFLVLLTSLTSLVAPAWADTVTLHTGETLTGTILQETEIEVVIEVTVSRGIKDEKTLQKSEVASITKASSEDLAYDEVKKLRVGQNSFHEKAYETAIDALVSYSKTHPNSQYDGEIKANLTALREEAAQVKIGSVKVAGRWYTPSEAAKERTQIAGQRLLFLMREQANRGDNDGALNTFDQLEKEAAGSRAYPDAVELALSLIGRLAGELQRAIPTAKAQLEQFNQGVKLLAEPQKSQALASWNQKVLQADQAVAAATKQGLKWVPLYPNSEKSITALKATLGSESQRLSAISVTAMRNSIALADTAALALKNSQDSDVESRLKEAETLWAKNDLITSVKATMTDFKEKAKAEASEQAAAAAAAAAAEEAEAKAKAAAPQKTTNQKSPALVKKD